jgi:hypothetical protein
MTKFIWVRDIDKREHYININHIARVTKVPESTILKSEAYAYMVVNDGTPGGKEIRLFNDTYDTVEDVISKIQVTS